MSRQQILVVEDNPINQKVAEGMLAKMGYQVVTANNGEEAVAAVKNAWFDLVFMDIQMPVLDGFQATRRIHEEKDQLMNEAVPIVAMTAHAMTGYRDKCLEEGMDDYITKPISVQSLGKVLEKWLHGVRDPHEAAIIAGPVPRELFDEDAPVPFDRDGFIKRMMYDEPLAERIVEEFLKDMPTQIETLLKSIDQKKWDVVASQAHKIKGSSANICAVPLSEAAYQIEKVTDAKSSKALTDEVLFALRDNMEKAWHDLTMHLTGQQPAPHRPETDQPG